MTQETAFSYKYGNSIIHQCPSVIKIFSIPVISVIVFNVSFYVTGIIFILLTLVSFILRFTLKEQLRDLRAVLYYAFFLIFVKIIGSFATAFSSGNFLWPKYSAMPQIILNFFINEKETWYLLLKLLCVMQSASIVFKTSTSLQIREGLTVLEIAIRKVIHLKNTTDQNYAPVSQAVSIFICFIPQVAKNWQQAERAWKARGGKKSLRMLFVLLPVFFSVGMKQAYNSARAIAVRSN